MIRRSTGETESTSAGTRIATQVVPSESTRETGVNSRDALALMVLVPAGSSTAPSPQMRADDRVAVVQLPGRGLDRGREASRHRSPGPDRSRRAW